METDIKATGLRVVECTSKICFVLIIFRVQQCQWVLHHIEQLWFIVVKDYSIGSDFFEARTFQILFTQSLVFHWVILLQPIENCNKSPLFIIIRFFVLKLAFIVYNFENWYFLQMFNPLFNLVFDSTFLFFFYHFILHLQFMKSFNLYLQKLVQLFDQLWNQFFIIHGL